MNTKDTEKSTRPVHRKYRDAQGNIHTEYEDAQGNVKKALKKGPISPVRPP